MSHFRSQEQALDSNRDAQESGEISFQWFGFRVQEAAFDKLARMLAARNSAACAGLNRLDPCKARAVVGFAGLKKQGSGSTTRQVAFGLSTA